MSGTGETGATYYCQEFQGYSAVGAPLSNYDGEVASTHSAATQLENYNNPAKVPKQPSTLHSAKSQIKSAFERWNCQWLQRLSLGNHWESLVSRGPLDHNLPRAVSVAAFWIRTGHDYLAAHLHRINVLPSAECQLCGYGTMNAERLRTCSALNHSKNYQNSIFKEANLYWSARHLMAEQPRVSIG
ncbi:hypothetical protein TNCT_610951 [Trichonephila clavata]|uniref:Reverse transcriptase n=1 Tax=Trichonephila clavata TaxID=2740835 RepID=A0A8X6KHE1_TRICU|nr:hypothetical protein TNCT_610951 [Trichonephila clavata]